MRGPPAVQVSTGRFRVFSDPTVLQARTLLAFLWLKVKAHVSRLLSESGLVAPAWER
jgi:hypothetical protein